MIDVINFFTEKKESSQSFLENVNQKQIVGDYNSRVKKLENKRINSKFGMRNNATKPATWRAQRWHGLGLGSNSVDKKKRPEKVSRRKKIHLNLLNRRR